MSNETGPGPTVSEVVAGYLERAGFTVGRAEDGRAALERRDCSSQARSVPRRRSVAVSLVVVAAVAVPRCSPARSRSHGPCSCPPTTWQW
ncbi:hypothetical protein [Streptomyces virginiae]|uniref:hypothetical protein n=1 Tax=Streptomyces virginiae TaxID=1961 RepID=UPI00345523B6